MGKRNRHPKKVPDVAPTVKELPSLDEMLDEIPKEEFFQQVDKLAPKSKVDYHLDETGKTETHDRIVKLRYIPVAWGIPFDEVVFSKWVINTIGLPMMPWDTVITTTSTYLPDARNTIHKNFVEASDAEWLVMLDSDVLPPLDFLHRLMAHKKKMVGGWYRKKGDLYQPVVYDFSHNDEDGKAKYDIRHEPGYGLESVDAAGAGCWLMHRDVAEAIGPKPYDMIRGGEDLELCRKVVLAGFELFIDWDIACAHCGVAIV